jgi:mannitol 2-dehydrogenase
MCEGTREDGSVIEPNDPIWDSLNAVAKAAKADPLAWLNQRDLYGDLADNAAFQASFSHWLSLIWADGLEAALRTYVQG